MKMFFKKIKETLKEVLHYDPRKKYVDAGILDLSGQGRDCYGGKQP